MTLRETSDSDRGPAIAQRATAVLIVLSLAGAIVAAALGIWVTAATLVIIAGANGLTNRSLAWTRETRRLQREERR